MQAPHVDQDGPGLLARFDQGHLRHRRDGDPSGLAIRQIALRDESLAVGLAGGEHTKSLEVLIPEHHLAAVRLWRFDTGDGFSVSFRRGMSKSQIRKNRGPKTL
jgi:hypothetical protein